MTFGRQGPMNYVFIYILVGLLIVGGALMQFLVIGRRHKRGYREHLEPILEEHGLRFVSSQFPGWFKTGPFPKFDTEVGGPQTRIGGFRGEFDQYRRVTASDSDGREWTLWALLEFEAFRFRRVRWRAKPEAAVPDSMKVMLEM